MNLNYDLLDAKRLPAQERYLRDPIYAALVDNIYAQIQDGKYTPTELREAVILAATKFEMYHCRRMVYVEDSELILFNPERVATTRKVID